MATVNYTELPIRNERHTQSQATVTWAPLTSANQDSTPFEWAEATDRSIQAAGSFSGAAHAKLQGSNDGANYAQLTDPLGNNIDFTAAGIKQVAENTRFVKVVGSGGDGSMSVVMTLHATRQR